jgi:hypothetical protein
MPQAAVEPALWRLRGGNPSGSSSAANGAATGARRLITPADLSEEAKKKFRNYRTLLSLDGGGLRGLITGAGVLQGRRPHHGCGCTAGLQASSRVRVYCRVAGLQAGGGGARAGRTIA